MSDLRRARVAVALIFAVHGAVAGSFGARLPWIASRLHTDPGGLGLALLCASLGCILTMSFATRLTHRFRTRPTIGVLVALWCLALIPPALAGSLPVLCLAMLWYGVTVGIADVAMNAQGVVVEQRLGRSIMSSLHGMWSTGVLVGSAGGILAAHADVDARLHFTVVAVVLLVVTAVVSPLLLDVAPPAEEDAPSFALPSRPVLLIGLVAFCAVFAEASSADWAAVYLTDVSSAAPGLAAAAVTGFSATMAVTRLLGDRVVDRFGPVGVVRFGGATAAVGALTVAAARHPALVIAGFALIGLGVAVVVPLAFTAAGNAGPRPGQQIAGVATIAYGAGLAAPATVGGIGHVSSLPVAFLVVAVLAALVTVGAGTVRRRTARPVEHEPTGEPSALADPGVAAQRPVPHLSDGR
jgi:MFS family permease